MSGSNTTGRKRLVAAGPSTLDSRKRAPAVQHMSAVDWNKFTNFRSRNTRRDLEILLRSVAKSKSRRKDVLEQADKAGLYPIHWAAINNRSDMIESLYEAGSPLAKPCRNRLFANGTPLHLAAMNGNLEAAAMLLSKSRELQSHKTRPKSLAESSRVDKVNDELENEAKKSSGVRDEDEDEEGDDVDDNNDDTKQMLEARDADGQTPLMRAAAPRSKRMDAIRDLLRKNFWSLSGRPAEMALFLICMGADWRLTEPQNGMNLLHLAIVNDYDDIVSLLLVLDKDLINACTLKRANHSRLKEQAEKSKKEGQNTQMSKKQQRSQIKLKVQEKAQDGFENVSLRSSTPSASETESNVSSISITDSEMGSPSSSEGETTATTESDYYTESSDESGASGSPTSGRQLIDSRKNKADELLAAGLKPLQLAILYGRISAISQLWRANQQLKMIEQQQQQQQQSGARRNSKDDKARGSLLSRIEAQKEALRGQKQSVSNRELKRVLIKACYSNKLELAKFLKPALLKGALALDLALLALFWTPSYASSGVTGGLFIVSYVLCMALTLRVMLKNPGYLRRNSIQYVSELANMLEGKSVRKAPANQHRYYYLNEEQKKASASTAGNANEQLKSEQAQEIRRRSRTAPLIKLEITESSKAVDAKQQDKSEQPSPAPPSKTNKTDASGPKSDPKQKKIKSPPTPPPPQQPPQPPRVVGLNVNARASVDAFRDLQDKVRLFCHKCQCIRRPRSRHCNSCNHCVQDFDHHCIYLGCCIGRYNRLDFLMALVALSITSIYGTFLQQSMVFSDAASATASATTNESESSSPHLWHLLGFVWIFKYVIIGGLSAFLNMRRACLGVTLYEEIRSRRIRRTFGRSGPPEEISKSHRAFSTLKGSFWRYAPDRFLTGDLSQRQILANLREFTNYISPGEYVLTFICTDTPLARSLTSSDSRIKQLYKFV